MKSNTILESGISEIRSYHCFIPISESLIEIKRLSTYIPGTKVFLGENTSSNSSTIVDFPNSEEY